MDGGTIWSLGIVSLVHVERIMRVSRIVRTRMVHVMMCIVSVISVIDRGVVIVSQFWYCVILSGKNDVSKFVRMRLRGGVGVVQLR